MKKFFIYEVKLQRLQQRKKIYQNGDLSLNFDVDQDFGP